MKSREPMAEQEELVRICNLRVENGIVIFDVLVKTTRGIQLFEDIRMLPGDSVSITQDAYGIQPERN